MFGFSVNEKFTLVARLALVVLLLTLCWLIGQAFVSSASAQRDSDGVGEARRAASEYSTQTDCENAGYYWNGSDCEEYGVTVYGERDGDYTSDVPTETPHNSAPIPSGHEHHGGSSSSDSDETSSSSSTESTLDTEREWCDQHPAYADSCTAYLVCVGKIDSSLNALETTAAVEGCRSEKLPCYDELQAKMSSYSAWLDASLPIADILMAEGNWDPLWGRDSTVTTHSTIGGIHYFIVQGHGNITSAVTDNQFENERILWNNLESQAMALDICNQPWKQKHTPPNNTLVG